MSNGGFDTPEFERVCPNHSARREPALACAGMPTLRSRRQMSWLRVGFSARLVLGAALGAAASGCTPKIGDRCSLNTDCSIDNTRACDNSQPNGYCTVLNCGPNSCPDNAACVAFQAGVPGCPYDDYASPARTARTFCMETCKSDSDCRQSDGYVCSDPTGQPWSARIVDSDYARRVCLLPPDPIAPSATRPAAVCPGGVPPSDGGTTQSGSGGGVDAGEKEDAADATAEAFAADAGVEAGDATSNRGDDASLNGADAAADGAASVDAAVDAPMDVVGTGSLDSFAGDANGGGE